MPLIAVPERFKPAGREPALIDNKNGAVPPVAFSVCEYVAPADPLGKVGALVMVRPAATVRLNPLLALTEVVSVTCAVKLKVPELVGVPLRVPFAGLSESPPGSKPAVMLQV